MHLKLDDHDVARLQDGRTVHIVVDGESVTVYPPEAHHKAPVDPR